MTKSHHMDLSGPVRHTLAAYRVLEGKKKLHRRLNELCDAMVERGFPCLYEVDAKAWKRELKLKLSREVERWEEGWQEATAVDPEDTILYRFHDEARRVDSLLRSSRLWSQWETLWRTKTRAGHFAWVPCQLQEGVREDGFLFAREDIPQEEELWPLFDRLFNRLPCVTGAVFRALLGELASGLEAANLPVNFTRVQSGSLPVQPGLVRQVIEALKEVIANGSMDLLVARLKKSQKMHSFNTEEWLPFGFALAECLLFCLEPFEALRTLRIKDVRWVDGEVLASWLGKSPDLRMVSLEGCDTLTTEDVRGIASLLTGLEELRLVDLPRVDGASIARLIGANRDLQTLEIAECAQVHELDLSRWTAALERLGHLHHLIVRDLMQISPSALRAWSKEWHPAVA